MTRVRARVSARASARVRGGRLRAWAELLRLPALFTVPGDALAGAAAVGARPGRGTFLAIGSSLCLYEAGMALNDWADRAEDAVDRPHRPIPSGRIHPAAALTAAGAFTAAGLCLAFRAGRTTGALSTALAATVWAYDLGLKHTPAGPVAMGAARGLDVLLGASASHTASNAGRETRETPDTREGHGALRSGTGGGREVASAGREFGLRRGAAGTVGASSGVRVAVRSGASGGGEVACAGREFGPLKDAAGAVGAGSGVRAARLFGEGRGPEAASARREFGPLKDAAGAVGAGSGVRAALLFGEGRGAEAASARREFGPLKDAAGVMGAGPGTRAARRSGPARRAAVASAARELGLLLEAPRGPARGREARGPGRRPDSLSAAFPAALTLAAHTAAVTTVSRNETTGGSPATPAAALAIVTALTTHLTKLPAGRGVAAPFGLPGPTAYAATTARPLLHATLNPSPPLTQRAVGAGIRAMIPLQAALAARSGAPGTALLTAALAPLARRFSRKVSVT